ncbi:MAG: glutaminase domain-containing protein [Limnochordia bacterium]
MEYTQAPFYLAVWPELLGLQLDIWPRFTHDGEIVLGERGKGTVMFSHDIGCVTDIDRQRYHHHMPVEENTNYILLSYAYWRRSGDHSRVRRHADVIRSAMEFLRHCDTTGNGVPDMGMANTIDDASPAVQFGKEQTYLAVKTMAALQVGVEMLDSVGQGAVCEPYRSQVEKILQVLEEKGWQDDHFVTLLDPRADAIKDPWSGKMITDVRKVPGWDAAHIYTTNGLALLDMIGRATGMDEERLRQDLRVATKRCMSKYGCRHSDYLPPSTSSSDEGGVGRAAKVGWISMNMMRDMTAFYR